MGDVPAEDPVAFARRYPFPRTGYSFLFANGRVVPIREFAGADWNAVVLDSQGATPAPDYFKEFGLAPAPLSAYAAVIAAGSNASPERLARKYAQTPLPAVFPVLKARLAGFDCVYSAHFTRYGSIAAALAPCAGAEAEVYVTLLDPRQLAVMHASEGLGRHYRFARLDEIALKVDDGPALAAAHFYLSLGGAVTEGGQPIGLAEVDAASPLPRRTQSAMLARAQALLGQPGDDPDWFIARIIAEDDFREEMTAKLRRFAEPLDFPGVAIVEAG